MNQQHIILASSPWYLAVCLLVAIGLAWLLYQAKHPWTNPWNRSLMVVRACLVFVLLFLLLEPIVRQIRNAAEKPVMVLLYDNSASIAATLDSAARQALQTNIDHTREVLTEKGYDVRVADLQGELQGPLRYKQGSTDLNAALRQVQSRYEGRRVAGVVLASDGIYNSGISPLYASYSFPIHSIGIGDTLQRTDIAIKSLSYNKIAYQGNRFPIRAEVSATNLSGQTIRVSLRQGNAVLDVQEKVATNGQLLTFDFQPEAREQGIRKFDVEVAVVQGEYNTQNNRSSAFIEIVEGRKKILVVAAAPHPDIKALREVVEKNANYEFLLYIPGLADLPPASLDPTRIDLAIFYQAPDLRGKTQTVFQQFVAARTALLLVVGQQSDLRALAQANMPVRFDVPPREYDEVTPAGALSFPYFTLTPETNTIIADFPPVSVHFGKLRLPLTAIPLLQQRVGSVATDKPLLAVDVQDNRKIGVMLGEGFWRWRLNEFDRTEGTVAFDEIWGKLVQYLSTAEDKRKFRSYPIQQQFNDTEPAVFESQVYNDLFEPVYGNTIALEITNEQGQRRAYTYVTSPGNIRYQVGGLQEGVYRYAASTTLQGKKETVRGEFVVVSQQAELQYLTADFDLLRKLSSGTGGYFVRADQLNRLEQQLSATQATTVLHSEETFQSLIHLKWIFWLVVVAVSVEWFFRKYLGGY